MVQSKVTPNRDLKNCVYEILKQKLINCDYMPGSLLNESQLSADLGASRTPVRESLSRLEKEGFIRILPKKGIYVTDISLNDVMQIFQVRLEIEPVTLKLAGKVLPLEELQSFYDKFSQSDLDEQSSFRLDTSMHLFLVEYCGNRLLIEFMQSIFDKNTRIVIASKQNEFRIHDAKQEHMEVLSLLMRREYSKASEALRNHIESCRRASLDFLYNQHFYMDAPVLTYKRELQKLNI